MPSSRLAFLVVLLGVLVTVQPTVSSVLALSLAALCVAVLSQSLVKASVRPVLAAHPSYGRQAVHTRQCDPDAAGRPRPRAPGQA